MARGLKLLVFSAVVFMQGVMQCRQLALGMLNVPELDADENYYMANYLWDANDPVALEAVALLRHLMQVAIRSKQVGLDLDQVKDAVLREALSWVALDSSVLAMQYFIQKYLQDKDWDVLHAMRERYNVDLDHAWLSESDNSVKNYLLDSHGHPLSSIILALWSMLYTDSATLMVREVVKMGAAFVVNRNVVRMLAGALYGKQYNLVKLIDVVSPLVAVAKHAVIKKAND